MAEEAKRTAALIMRYCRERQMKPYSLLILLLFSIFLLVPFLSLRSALLVYIAGSLVLPYLHFGDLFIRFELIYAPWLLLFLVSRMLSGSSLRVHKLVILYFLYFVVVLVSTLVSLLEFSDQTMSSLIKLYGLLRPLFVMLIFMNATLDKTLVRSALKLFLLLSVPINLFSVIQFIGIDAAEVLTKEFYISPAVSAPYEVLMKTFGRLARTMSVFESPVYNANYTLMVILAVLTTLASRERIANRQGLYLAGVLAFLAGILTLSVTFLLGAMVLLGIIAWSNLRFPRRLFRLTRAAAAVGIAGVLIFILSPRLQDLARGGLAYQLQRITSAKLFETRYNPEMGILSDTYRAIMESPIIGHGAVIKGEAFVGDTFYVTTLYMGGFVGLGIYLFLLYRVLVRSGARRNLPVVLGLLNALVFQLTLLLLVTGFGAPSFTMRRASEWYWALLGMSLNRNLYEEIKWCNGK